MSDKTGRFSIAILMLGVTVAAADCAILRIVWDTTIELAVMALPLLNFMLIGLWRIRSRPSSRPFWVGFEVSLMTSTAVMATMIWMTPVTFSIPLQWLSDKKFLGEGSSIELAIAVVGAIYSLPPILFATCIGWLAGRYRIAMIRRPRATIEVTTRTKLDAPDKLETDQSTGRAQSDGLYPALNG